MKAASPGEVIRVGAIEVRYIVEGSDTDGALAQFETTVPPNARVPAPHRHVTYDETVYGLAGTCTFIVEGSECTLTPGLVLFIRRGAVHQFINRGTDTARFLVTVTPGVLSPAFFREVGAVLGGPGTPDMKLITEIMRRHGLQAVQANA
jgi:quercetin dioxygenase-like cupin family protein